MNRAAFTLLEVLVALTIFAVAAAGLLAASTQNVRQTQRLEDKTFALWAAQNHLAVLRNAATWPELGTSEDRADLAGRTWVLHTVVSTTPSAAIRKIEVTAEDAAHTVRTIATSYKGAR